MSTIHIRFVHADQTEETITTTTGQSLMKAAVDANIHGIEAGSRLSCQVRLTPELDGLVVRLPASQH
jgi:2Fe-2S ferredoxin